MSTPRRTLKKEAAIRDTAGKALTGKGTAKAAPKTPVGGVKAPENPGSLAGGRSTVKPIGKAISGKGKGRGPVYEVPKPVRPRAVKK